MPKLKFQATLNWEREEEAEYISYIKAKIKDARENAGLTQSQLADKLGRTQAYFSKLEGGGPEGRGLVPSIVEVLGIAHFTETPIQFFLPIQDAREDVLTGMEWQLIAHFRKIDSDEVRELALSTVKQLAGVRKPKAK
jgi:transcriptional regulator with XRE-family HTH domain